MIYTFTDMLSAIADYNGDKLPNYTLQSISAYPNEYVTDIVLNRGCQRLLQNDIFLWESYVDILNNLPFDLSAAVNSLSTTVTAYSGYWTTMSDVVSSAMTQWVVVDPTLATFNFGCDAIPAWRQGGPLDNHYLDAGFQVNASNSGILADDHTWIPTSQTVKEAISNSIHPDWVRQASPSSFMVGRVAVWAADKTLGYGPDTSTPVSFSNPNSSPTLPPLPTDEDEYSLCYKKETGLFWKKN